MFDMHVMIADPMLAALPVWLNKIWTILQMLLGFSVIVFVHELGHFAAAKWAGVRVERFAIGFGKELFGFTKGETRYSFNALPLGGYVKMLGQEDFVVDKSGELKVKPDPRSFTNKSVAKRMVIVCAGVVMNLIFAAIAFTIVAMVGLMRPPAIVGFVDESKPAGLAGLLPGDRIKTIDGVEVEDFQHLMSLISLSPHGESISVTVERNAKVIEPPFEIVPEYQEDAQRRQIGVGPAWNSRVMISGASKSERAPADELQTNDEITHVFVNGERASLDTPTNLIQAFYAHHGAPIKLVVKRPKNQDTLTDEQLQAKSPDIESEERVVHMQPIWSPMSYEIGSTRQSLLGFVPRLTIWAPYKDSSFEKAGVEPKDVITRIDSVDHPTYPELVEAMERNAGNTIDLHVRRRGAANGPFDAATVDFLANHRDEFIRTYVAAPDEFTKFVSYALSGSSLSDDAKKKVGEAFANIENSNSLRKMLERVDVHKLLLDVPGGSILKGKVSPDDEGYIRYLDEGEVFVSDIVEKFGDRKSTAAESKVPRFSHILAVNDNPLANWNAFANTLLENAGKQIKITYRVRDEIRDTAVTVPGSIQTALALNRGDRILKIAGKDSVDITVGEGEKAKKATLRLPDRRAIEKLLKQHVGETVEVEYAQLLGEKKTASFDVTESNYEPWPARINYELPIQFYPLLERHPISNPIDAFVAGIGQAYRATVDTIRTIKQLVTANLGTRNMSGPLGIIDIGSKVADKSVIDLIWLLGLLSANLAVINFLPLPIVDGGLFLFLVLEKIRGEPVSIRVQVATQIIGIALIATIFILVTAQDILKMFS